MEGVLRNISKRDDLKNRLDEMKSPMPLQAILLTRDNIGRALKGYKDKAFGKIESEAHAQSIRKILSMGADHILTTNYSYELEYASQPSCTLSEHKITAMQTHTENKEQAEKKYLLSTYNQFTYAGISNKVWHIHGEARKTDSMVLGHYYYGNLLHEIKKLEDNKSDIYSLKQIIANCVLKVG